MTLRDTNGAEIEVQSRVGVRQRRPIVAPAIGELCRVAFIVGLILMHVSHVYIHQFEGGFLDGLLVQADAFAARIAQE